MMSSVFTSASSSIRSTTIIGDGTKGISCPQAGMHKPRTIAVTKTLFTKCFIVSISFLEDLDCIERAGIVAKDFTFHMLRQIGSLPKELDRIDVARYIRMAVIGTNHQAVLSRLIYDIRQIVGVLAGHEHTIFARDVVPPFAP